MKRLYVIAGTIVFLFMILNVNAQSFNWYSQSDPDWKHLKLGYSKSISIAKSGCVLSCIAMMLNAEAGTKEVTPRNLNWWLRKHHGFINADMILEVPPKFDGLLNGMEFEERSWKRNDWRFLARHLAVGNKVIVKVGRGKGHWVLVTERSGQLYKPSSYKVNDPALKSWHKRSLSYWGGFRSAVAYSGRWIDDTTIFLKKSVEIAPGWEKDSFIHELAGEKNAGDLVAEVHNSLNVAVEGYFILAIEPRAGKGRKVLDYTKVKIEPKEDGKVLFQTTELDNALMNQDQLYVMFSKGYTVGEFPGNGIRLKVRYY